jgi:hypothetical protein
VPVDFEDAANAANATTVEPELPANACVVSGTVSDPSGAKIRDAAIEVEGAAFERDLFTDSTGHFSVNLAAGTYHVKVVARGFRAFETEVTVTQRSNHALVDAKLQIATEAEEITVENQDSMSSGENKSALVFKGAQLNAFSNDDSTFQHEILALAGTNRMRPPEIIVDGFSNGRFPPKSAIREIRINQNPYSAEYDHLGVGRVEIFTRPGTDKLHGTFDTSGTDNVLNARNPYTPIEPPYYTLNLDGNLTGSFSRRTSFFTSGLYNDLQNNAVVDAIDPTLLTPLAEAVAAPQRTQTYSGRLDRQMTMNNTFIGRYEYNRVTVNNSGVGLLVLPSEGLNVATSTQTLQMTDTQIIGYKTISEAHFQYIRTRQEQNPVSTCATVVVEGVFNGGGSLAQALGDNRDQYEFQELATTARGKHYLRFGGRYRLLREANFTTANYNGQFIFPDIQTYKLALSGETPAQIFANGGGSTQYNLTGGDPRAVLLTGDLGVFAEDEWKVRKNLTLDYGFRFQSQTAVPDHADPAPRLGFAWSIQRRKTAAPIVILRGGGGIFYDLFEAANILTAIRQQSGTRQPEYFVDNPNFYHQYLNAPPPVSLLGALPPTIYNINPHLKTEYGIQAGLTAERGLGKYGNVSASYYFTRGDHQYLSRNINAPLPGTYNPSNPNSGVRPFGGAQNIYQFDSGGTAKEYIFSLQSQFALGKRVTAFSLYSYSHVNANISNATTFPSNSYSLAQDYGRSAQPLETFFTGASVQLPFAIGADVFISTEGGTPFNITTGTDLNGDTIFNDRPAFATNPTARSVIYKTAYGTFDANPQPGEKIIPINYGNSPDMVFAQMKLSRSFLVGPRPASHASASGTRTPAPRPDRPYTLLFAADAYNVFNHVNPGTPVGVLSSPLFGQSISLNEPFSAGATSSNRAITLSCTFSF